MTNGFNNLCSFCKNSFSHTDSIVICPSCGAAHHYECWERNKQCSTYGCNGYVMGNAFVTNLAAIGGAYNNAAAKAVNSIETLYSSNECYIFSDLNVVLESVSLIRDLSQNTFFANCSFTSLNPHTINAMIVSIECFDVWGNRIKDPILYQYLDLCVYKGSNFARNVYVPITYTETRRIVVKPIKLSTLDGNIIDASVDPVTFPAAITLGDHFKNRELQEQYLLETSRNATYAPCESGNYWRCTCGTYNTTGDSACFACKTDKQKLFDSLDIGMLTKNLEARKLEEQKQREKEAKRIQKAEEEVKAEQERLQLEIKKQEDAIKVQKKKKLVITTVILSALVIILIIFATIFFFIPYSQYSSACDDLESGHYIRAYNSFIELDGFLDSEEMADECQYRRALSLMDEENYSNALTIFADISGYKDSDDLYIESTYCLSVQHMENGRYYEAYSIFNEISDYKDVYNLKGLCISSWVTKLISDGDSGGANDFCDIVDLDSDLQPKLYAAILSNLKSNSSYTYWNQVGRKNVVRKLLDCLPSSYMNVQDIKSLFGDSKSDFNFSADFITEHSWLFETFDFIKDYYYTDDNLIEFLMGYWTSYSDYYLYFFPNEDNPNVTTSRFNLPSNEKPENTRYYDIQDCVYVWLDGNSNVLEKVFKISIFDIDTIEVLCYSNNKTYYLYR